MLSNIAEILPPIPTVNNKALSSNVKKTNIDDLIKGYCKYLPDSVKNMIFLYYPKMNGISYSWNISKIQQIKQIHASYHPQPTQNMNEEFKKEEIAADHELIHYELEEADTIDTLDRILLDVDAPQSQLQETPFVRSFVLNIDSDAFNVGLPNKFFLKLQRNKHNSFFKVKLMSFPLPDEYVSVIFHVEIYCHFQHSLEFTDIVTIDNRQNSNNEDYNYYNDYNQNKRKNKLENLKTSCLKEFDLKIYIDRFLLLESIVIDCNINILEIVATPKLSHKSYRYYTTNYLQENEKILFYWNITHKQLENKQFHSDVFYDMFVLKYDFLEAFVIQLCGLPANSFYIGVKFEIDLICDELDVHFNLISKIISFSYNFPIYKFPNETNHVLASYLKQQNQIKLLCKAKIIQKVDSKNSLENANASLVTKSILPFVTESETPAAAYNIVEDTDNEKDKQHEHEFDIFDHKQYEKQIEVSKLKIVKLKQETFILHIDGNELLKKIKFAIKSDKKYVFYSDIFVLHKVKWCIVLKNKPKKHYDDYDYGYLPNKKAKKQIPKMFIFVRCLASDSFNCKIKLHLIQTGNKDEFLCEFESSYRNSMEDKKQYLIENGFKIDSLSAITIKCDIFEFGETNDTKEEEKNENKTIKLWLQEIDLSKYYDLFTMHGIDSLETLHLIEKDHLKEMGIWKIGHQMKILQHIKKSLKDL